MMRYLGLTFCNLMGAKLNSVHDYLPLPWDDKLAGKELTEEEVDQLLELMRKENEEIEKKKNECRCIVMRDTPAISVRYEY